MKNTHHILNSTILIMGFMFFSSVGSLNNDHLIKKDSIGSVMLCDNVNTIDLLFISDSTFNSDGFYFFGKYFGTEQEKLPIDLTRSNDHKIIYRIITKSPIFETEQGISVNSSLRKLVKLVPEIKFTSVIAGYEDLYFFQQFDSSQIEFRFDRSTELEIYKLGVLDYYYGIDDVEGMRQLVNRIGDSARIREITILRTKSCKN